MKKLLNVTMVILSLLPVFSNSIIGYAQTTENNPNIHQNIDNKTTPSQNSENDTSINSEIETSNSTQQIDDVENKISNFTTDHKEKQTTENKSALTNAPPVEKLDNCACTVYPEALKRLNGRDLKADEFSFELKYTGGDRLPTRFVNNEYQDIQTNDYYGKVNFTPIQFIYNDYGENYSGEKNFEFSIKEINKNDPNISYDNKSFRMLVKVYYTAYSTPFTETTYLEGDNIIEYPNVPTFNNFVKVNPTPTEVKLEAQKELKGRTLKNGEFSFELRDDQNNLIQTVKNTDGGKINFDAIKYDKAGVYNYTIKEVKTDEKGIIWDEHVIKATVTVKDVDNQLVATVTYDGSKTFINNYNPTPTEVKLEAQKELKGRTLKNGEFSFELRDDQNNLIQTVKNTDGGKINFDAIKYDKAGVYNYTIKEVNTDEKGITWDEHVIKATVTVKDVDNQLVATVTYDGSKTFINNYNPTPTEVKLEAQKELKGRTLKNGEFSFELRDDQNNLIQTVKNTDGGKINFDAIKYDKAGVYNYTIKEVKTDEKGIIWDEHVIKATVTVKDVDNQLVATVTYDGDKTFINNYNPTIPVKPDNNNNNLFSKIFSKNSLPKTGEVSNHILEIVGLLSLLTLSIIYIYTKKIKLK